VEPAAPSSGKGDTKGTPGETPNFPGEPTSKAPFKREGNWFAPRNKNALNSKGALKPKTGFPKVPPQKKGEKGTPWNKPG